ncbi:hypothetical protein OHR68_20115 [Spirillospora sp. NBC_00431]
MSAPKRALLTAMTTLAATLVASAVTAASATAATTPQHAPTTQAGPTITCQEVHGDPHNLTGYDCDTRASGNLSNFTLVERRTKIRHRCATGHAEGPHWVTGFACRRVA